MRLDASLDVYQSSKLGQSQFMDLLHDEISFSHQPLNFYNKHLCIPKWRPLTRLSAALFCMVVTTIPQPGAGKALIQKSRTRT